MKISKLKFNLGLIALVFALGLSSCKQNTTVKATEKTTPTEKKVSISESEVLNAQKAWGEGIVKIGKAFTNKADFRAVASDHINKFYNYHERFCIIQAYLSG